MQEIKLDSAYSYEPHWFESPQGRMHYVDEGKGPPLVFVHGMPTWSFLWRHFIREFSPDHRVIAVDHLGFGRSYKPEDGDYHPRTLSENLTALIGALGLKDITLVVHDFGGPIGLGHAVRHPESVQRLVLFNTWMWSLSDHPGARKLDRAVSGWLGHVLYRWFNASARWAIPSVLAKGNRLELAAHRAYIEATRSGAERVGQLSLARHLIGASDWYDELWQSRARLAGKPLQLIWGTQDPTFGQAERERWTEEFPEAQVTLIDEAGHFPQEEAPGRAIDAMRGFIEARQDGSKSQQAAG